MTRDTSNSSQLLFENQICYPLYSAANALVRAYRPLLDELDITYLQYMVLMLLWQESSLNVKELGQRLRLDSGTLTPLLKRLESKGPKYAAIIVDCNDLTPLQASFIPTCTPFERNMILPSRCAMMPKVFKISTVTPATIRIRP